MLSDGDVDRISHRVVDVMLERERLQREKAEPMWNAGIMPPFSIDDLGGERLLAACDEAMASVDRMFAPPVNGNFVATTLDSMP